MYFSLLDLCLLRSQNTTLIFLNASINAQCGIEEVEKRIETTIFTSKEEHLA